MILDDVDDCLLPFNVTNQLVPEGSPDSVKVTEYNLENVTVVDMAAPLTDMDPDARNTE